MGDSMMDNDNKDIATPASPVQPKGEPGAGTEGQGRKAALCGLWINLCRFVVAAAFTFSGFVKAIDPMGTQYKIQDYLTAFGWTWVPALMPIVLSVLLCTVEFLIGVFLFLGIRRRTTSLVSMLMLIVFTPLTLYLAIANPVSDCGCFGDAVVLTNWQTFGKNVVLLVATVSLCMRPLLMPRFISERNQWIISLYTLVYIVLFASYNLYHLPLFDFRPYHIGVNIPKAMAIPEGAKQPKFVTTFIMEKNGVRKEFSLENYPDSTWKFIDSKSVQTEAGYVPPIHDFCLQEAKGGEDITEQVLSAKGYTFFLVAPWLEWADQTHADLINELYDYCSDHGYGFYCLTSSTGTTLSRWMDATGAEYPVCNVDATTLKTIVRSNPGLVLLHGGTVVNKWGNNDFPDEYQLTGPLEKLPLAQLTPRNPWRKIADMLAWYVVPLFLVVFADQWWERRKKAKKIKL
jgi:triosephosphate isomerase